MAWGMRLFKLTSCDGKQRFDSRSEANAVNERRKRRHNRDAAKSNVYRCKFCGSYHIGKDTKKAG